ncbi:sigma-70 family RNA polymerase sigma factor [Flagellatimonas centrodinii]|uniref:RNA polymerase sigma factor n=1 Tax=Flagellatimonas centrodinii TaxID=2806210 RepID=UPI001FEE4886|nr:sigma-70 family RNA polymerase sigma factor [Flagellatimonas centrodinii]ULQ45542.1 sigma-70 family RNA polymerase sigma factor [Flagellatimonas centrodinii]
MNTRRPDPEDSGAAPSPAEGQAEAPVCHSEQVANLVREHNQSLHAFLMTRVGDPHEAREVAQEAYVRMLQLDRPGAVGYLRGYLFKTAANIAIDRARERNNRARLLRNECMEDQQDELSPDRYALGQEEVETLRQALAELPEKLRRSFLLRHVDGLNAPSIGELLGVSARMVHVYLTRAGMYCQLRIQGYSPKVAREAIHGVR